MNNFFEAVIAGVTESLETCSENDPRKNIALAMLRHSDSPAQAMVRVLAIRLERPGSRNSMTPLYRFGRNDSNRRELMELLTPEKLDWYVAQFSQMTTARLFAETLMASLSPDHPSGDRALNRLCVGVLSLANGAPATADLGESIIPLITANRRVVLEVFENRTSLGGVSSESH